MQSVGCLVAPTACLRPLAMRAEILSALERHLLAQAARPLTISTYRRIAGLFLELLGDRPLVDAGSSDVEAFLARPRETGAPPSAATRNLEVVALRALFRSVGTADPTASFALKRAERRDPVVPNTTELRALFEAAALEPSPARALAQLALLFQAGLRVHEVVGLDVDQVDLTAASLVGVEGKNGSRVDVPLGPEAAELVSQWLAHHPTGTGPLFPGASASTGRTSVRSVQRLFVRLRCDAGITKPVTPHGLRHATATEAIGRGVSLPATAALMRHARVETTMGYVALASTARREAATRIGSAIPRSVLAVSQNSSGIRALGGRHDAVDADGDFCDAA